MACIHVRIILPGWYHAMKPNRSLPGQCCIPSHTPHSSCMPRRDDGTVRSSNRTHLRESLKIVQSFICACRLIPSVSLAHFRPCPVLAERTMVYEGLAKGPHDGVLAVPLSPDITDIVLVVLALRPYALCQPSSCVSQVAVRRLE